MPTARAGAGDGTPSGARSLAGRTARRGGRRPDRRRRRRQRRRGESGSSGARADRVRLMQDLRGAAEIVPRDLRRAGHWAAAESGVRRGDEPIVVNPHAEIAAASGPAAVVALSFSTGAGDAASIDDSERFGFRLRNGAIEVELGARNW